LRVLALDLATQFGYADWDGLHVESDTLSCAASTREHPDMRFIRFEAWIEQRFRKHQYDMVAYEQPHMRGGPSTEVLIGLMMIVRKLCARHGIPWTKKQSTEIKKFATGKGNASKEDMLLQAQCVYPEHEIKDDNQADALHLLALVVHEIFGEWIGDYGQGDS